MELSNIEIQRIYECMKWLNDKGNIKDPDFKSAFKKIADLNNRNANHFSPYQVTSKTIKNQRYRDLSPEAFDFIERRINQGYKNTYHSIMAVLEDRRKKVSSVDELRRMKSLIYENYIYKYKINDSDIHIFNEIFECAFNNSLTKLFNTNRARS